MYISCCEPYSSSAPPTVALNSLGAYTVTTSMPVPTCNVSMAGGGAEMRKCVGWQEPAWNWLRVRAQLVRLQPRGRRLRPRGRRQHKEAQAHACGSEARSEQRLGGHL